jgi:hypothetical protein
VSVDRVTQHHQGDGLPHNDPGGAADGGYSAWIGSTTFTMLRSPPESWATFGHNGTSFDVCFSGNRNNAPVTDLDLDLLRQCAAEARRRDWIVDHPTVYPHGTLYPVPPGYPTGSSPTECPGQLAVQRWTLIVAAYDANEPTPPGGNDVPANTEIVDAYSGPDGAWKLQYDGGVQTIRGPFYGSYFSLPASDRNDPNRRFLTICAPVNGAATGYSIVSLKGEAYTFKTKP